VREGVSMSNRHWPGLEEAMIVTLIVAGVIGWGIISAAIWIVEAVWSWI